MATQTARTELERGREAYQRQSWGDACAHLGAADRTQPLDPEDLERLATATHLLGRSAECIEAWERAHQAYLGRGDARRAARCASLLALQLMFKGESARASGWVARGQRLLKDGGEDSVEQGYLLLPVALGAVFAGNVASAHEAFAQAAAIAERFGDRDLVVMARQGQGRALIRLGETARGVALLDEVMVAVTAGEVSPGIVGDIYCSVIEGCQEMFDLRRAHEWTEALRQWCTTQPDRVPYRGTCLIRRAEILQLHGAWHDALAEARQARDWLSQPPPQRSVGAAFYQLAELHRLRGEFAKAEESYRQASHWGREPQPGLAQLRLAQGQIDAARTAICRALDEARDQRVRSRMLGPFVEIALAAGDISGAQAGATELATIATRVEAPFLRAVSASATGAVLLAQEKPQAALAELRKAWMTWGDLEAPYEAGRVRVLIGLACRALGDHDSAELELDAARRVFQQLGAAPDLARVNELAGRVAKAAAGLTAREVQVLALIATGGTNRAIADELAISEKTVARHVSNIFTKLGLSSRAAATAYAFRHHLVRAPTTPTT